MSNHYIVVGVTVEDAKTHPAYSGALIAVTPRSRAGYGYPITGYVMTDAFSELCEADTPAGESARRTLKRILIDLAHGTPHRVVQPRSIKELSDSLVGVL